MLKVSLASTARRGLFLTLALRAIPKNMHFKQNHFCKGSGENKQS